MSREETTCSELNPKRAAPAQGSRLEDLPSSGLGLPVGSCSVGCSRNEKLGCLDKVVGLTEASPSSGQDSSQVMTSKGKATPAKVLADLIAEADLEGVAGLTSVRPGHLLFQRSIPRGTNSERGHDGGLEVLGPYSRRGCLLGPASIIHMNMKDILVIFAGDGNDRCLWRWRKLEELARVARLCHRRTVGQR